MSRYPRGKRVGMHIAGLAMPALFIGPCRCDACVEDKRSKAAESQRRLERAAADVVEAEMAIADAKWDLLKALAGWTP